MERSSGFFSAGLLLACAGSRLRENAGIPDRTGPLVLRQFGRSWGRRDAGARRVYSLALHLSSRTLADYKNSLGGVLA